MLRSRGKSDALRVVRNLDAFPKVSEECQESSKIGGTRKQISLTADGGFHAIDPNYNEAVEWFADSFGFCFCSFWHVFSFGAELRPNCIVCLQ